MITDQQVINNAVVTKHTLHHTSLPKRLKKPRDRSEALSKLTSSYKQKYRKKAFAELFVSTGFNGVDALVLLGYGLTTAKSKLGLYLNDPEVSQMVDAQLEKALAPYDAQIHKTVSELQLLRQEAMTVVIDKETGEPRMKCLDTALRCLELELQYFGGMKKLAMNKACESMFVKPDEYEQSLIDNVD